MNKLVDEVVKVLDSLPVESFKNVHGEQFNIHAGENSVYMSGDEVNAMVETKIGKYVPLFNPNFNVWSKDELFQLGEALVKLYK